MNTLPRIICRVLQTKPSMSSVLRSLANCACRVTDWRIQFERRRLLLTAHPVMMTVCPGALLHGALKALVPLASIRATAKLLYWKHKSDVIPHCANVRCALVNNLVLFRLNYLHWRHFSKSSGSPSM